MREKRQRGTKDVTTGTIEVDLPTTSVCHSHFKPQLASSDQKRVRQKFHLGARCAMAQNTDGQREDARHECQARNQFRQQLEASGYRNNQVPV